MKLLPLPCKQQAQMTTQNGGPISTRRLEKIVLSTSTFVLNTLTLIFKFYLFFLVAGSGWGIN